MIVMGRLRSLHHPARDELELEAVLHALSDPARLRIVAALAADGTWMVASESVALEGTGHVFDRHVAPGEAVFIDLEGRLHARQCAQSTSLHPCIFEYVYLARPDSVLDGISVYQARLNLGETLAKRVVSTVPPSEIDVIIPIPESSRPSATQLAHLLGQRHPVQHHLGRGRRRGDRGRQEGCGEGGGRREHARDGTCRRPRLDCRAIAKLCLQRCVCSRTVVPWTSPRSPRRPSR